MFTFIFLSLRLYLFVYVYIYLFTFIFICLRFQIARAAAVFNVDEIVIFDESGAKGRYVDPWTRPMN